MELGAIATDGGFMPSPVLEPELGVASARPNANSIAASNAAATMLRVAESPARRA